MPGLHASSPFWRAHCFLPHYLEGVRERLDLSAVPADVSPGDGGQS